MKNFAVAIVVALWATCVSADPIFIKKPGCDYNETAQASITYTKTNRNIDELTKDLKIKLLEIEKLTEKFDLKKFDLSSANYNISPQQMGFEFSYQLNANLTFNIEPAEKANEVVGALNKSNYTTTLNVNFNQNSCAGTR